MINVRACRELCASASQLSQKKDKRTIFQRVSVSRTNQGVFCGACFCLVKSERDFGADQCVCCDCDCDSAFVSRKKKKERTSTDSKCSCSADSQIKMTTRFTVSKSEKNLLAGDASGERRYGSTGRGSSSGYEEADFHGKCIQMELCIWT